MGRVQVSVAACLTIVFGGVPQGPAGEFERIEGARLAAIAQGDEVDHLRVLTLKDLDRLPAALKDTRSTFLVVKTGAGHYARLLVSAALRKPELDDALPIPVLVLERFDTFEPGKSGSRLARGQEILLFDGFQFDLDSGQVVPRGQGGDIAFLIDGAAGPRVEARGKAEILTLKKPLASAAPVVGPSLGKSVVPGDFAGRYHLHADGRWSGLLELEVAADRRITGRFRSEVNGTSYPVTGQVAINPPHKATFVVKFPRAEQEYDAFLTSSGKNALAGTFLMTERTFGFFAVREGKTLESND